MAIVIFILILGLLIFVHELGHFVVARRNGIKAHEFGFGFPPRVFGVYKNDKGKYSFVRGGRHVETENTIYSLNWLPIGGFVKIKGEDGSGKKDPDSFAGKSAWIRIKVLLAGVTMNFILAWFLFSVGFMIGTPQEVVGSPQTDQSSIIINMVEDGSPADEMGIVMGDVIVSGGKNGSTVLNTVEEVQGYITQNKGEKIFLQIERNNQNLILEGIPRIDSSENQGALGIGLLQVETVSYGFFESFWRGLIELKNVLILIFETLGGLFFGETEGVDVTGIVGIAVYTGQIIPLGIVHILRFIAILSINLGIINALPFPALDGGRVLFILIEKIKGSPISEKVEQAFHTTGILFLIFLMIWVTFRDVVRFELVDKIRGIF